MGSNHSTGYEKLPPAPTTDYDYDYDEAYQHKQPLLLNTHVVQFPDNRAEIGKLMKKNAHLEKRLKDMATTVDQLKASVAAAAASNVNAHKQDMAKLEKKNADLEKKVVVMAADIVKLMKKNAKLEKQVAEMSTTNTYIIPLKASTAAATEEDLIVVAGSTSGVGQITTIDPFITFDDDLVLPEAQPRCEDCERRDIFFCLVLIVFLICVLIGINLPS